MISIRSFFSSFARYFYRRILNKLISDLKIDSLDSKINIIQNSVSKLEIKNNEIYSLTRAGVAISSGLGIDNSETISNQLFMEAHELVGIFDNQTPLVSDEIKFSDLLEKKSIENKNILVIGPSAGPLLNRLKRMKPKKITFISFSDGRFQSKIGKNNLEIRPSDLGKIYLPVFDVLLIPDFRTASLLIKRNLFGIATKIREMALLSVRINTFSISSNQMIFDFNWSGSNITYSDNLARKLIHNSGFIEITVNIDKFIKFSEFSYKHGLKILKNSFKKTDAHTTRTVFYKATKLPKV